MLLPLLPLKRYSTLPQDANNPELAKRNDDMARRHWFCLIALVVVIVSIAGVMGYIAGSTNLEYRGTDLIGTHHILSELVLPSTNSVCAYSSGRNLSNYTDIQYHLWHGDTGCRYGLGIDHSW